MRVSGRRFAIVRAAKGARLVPDARQSAPGALRGEAVLIDKRCAGDWASFGGAPAFALPLHVGCPNTGDRARLLGRVSDALERRWLTNDGPFVRELELRLAHETGVEHCIAVSSATAGLSLVARGLGLSGSVVMPSLTFVGTAHAFEWMGVRPVFADVDESGHALDPEAAAGALRVDSTAVVGVHLWGRGADSVGLEDLARRRGVRLVFDAAHAFGCERRGRALVSFGDAAVLSFHATKVVNGFEGGAVFTGDGELAERVRLMRNFGFRDYDAVVCLGVNAKMSEVSAAMVLTGMEAYGATLAAGCANSEAYAEVLEGVAGLRLVQPVAGDVWNHHYVVLEVDEADAGIDRDRLMRLLWAENVRARRYFYPGCHRMEPYVSRDGDLGGALRVTERLCSRLLQLPTGTAVNVDQARGVALLVHRAIEMAPTLCARRVLGEASNPLVSGGSA
jgi:dTDP-4-amino-4,6-dideoxygalactose transaminase